MWIPIGRKRTRINGDKSSLMNKKKALCFAERLLIGWSVVFR